MSKAFSPEHLVMIENVRRVGQLGVVELRENNKSTVLLRIVFGFVGKVITIRRKRGGIVGGETRRKGLSFFFLKTKYFPSH